MQPIERILTLWTIGSLSSEAVVSWADREILRCEEPGQEVIDLAFDGPEKCLRRPQFEFPARPVTLSYLEEFSLRAVAVNPASPESCQRFAKWAARHAMGEDLERAEVNFGYQLDHLLDDGHDESGAMELVRRELSKLLPQCRVIAAPFVESGFGC